jgi:glycosyltransferase involved in cell wall biosynthesis
MADSPSVSVIIPTYNRAKFVGDAIQSVLDQTFTDYEIIVVDDGSTDNTKAILGQFKDKIRYIYQENQGVSAARNRGIQAAQGEYIAFLDSDDLFLPTKLEKQIAYLLQNPDIGLVHSSFIIIDEFGRQMAVRVKEESKDMYRRFLLTSTIATSSVIMPRQVIDQIGGFDTTLSLAEDVDFETRVAQHFEVGVISTPLVKYREFPGNTPSRPKDLYKSFFYVLQKHTDQFHRFGPFFKRRAYSTLCFGIGNICVSNEPPEIKPAYCYLAKGFLYWPFNRRGYLLAFRLLFRTLFPVRIQHPLRSQIRKIMNLIFNTPHSS